MSQSSYRIELVPPEQWDSLLRHFPERTAFHLLGWIRAVAAAYGARPFLTAAMMNDRCDAVWPILDLHKGFLRIIGSPLPGWSTPYMGPLFTAEADIPAALEAFLQHRLFRRHAYFACKVMDRLRPVDLEPFGFTVELRYDTFRLDLSKDQDQLWSNLEGNCRNHIRKAQKQGVEVRAEASDAFVDEYWQMTLETFAKAQVLPTHNREIVAQMWKHLHAGGNLHALSAFHQSERVGTVLLPCDDQTIYYWGGASYLKHRDLSASNLLLWEAICLAKRCGLKTFDFISTTGGPGKFKQSFGPEAVMMCTHWERSSSRLMKALKSQYERYIRRRQQLPESRLVGAGR